MNAPLTVWKCDTCNNDITDVGKALVIWRQDDKLRAYDFRIVHKNLDGGHCDPGAKDGFVMNTELSRFLGADGLAYALSLLSPGPIMADTDVRVVGFNTLVTSWPEIVEVARSVKNPVASQGALDFGWGG